MISLLSFLKCMTLTSTFSEVKLSKKLKVFSLILVYAQFSFSKKFYLAMTSVKDKQETPSLKPRVAVRCRGFSM